MYGRLRRAGREGGGHRSSAAGRSRMSGSLGCPPTLKTPAAHAGEGARGAGAGGGARAPGGPAPARSARAARRGSPLHPGQWRGAAAASAPTPARPSPRARVRGGPRALPPLSAEAGVVYEVRGVAGSEVGLRVGEGQLMWLNDSNSWLLGCCSALVPSHPRTPSRRAPTVPRPAAPGRAGAGCRSRALLVPLRGPAARWG